MDVVFDSFLADSTRDRSASLAVANNDGDDDDELRHDIEREARPMASDAASLEDGGGAIVDVLINWWKLLF